MNAVIKMSMIAAAAMTMAGAASAQKLSAEIPFAFRAGNKLMMPGTYEVNYVRTGAGLPLLHLYNRENGTSAMMGAIAANTPGINWDAKHRNQPTMAFTCADTRCGLTKVYAGDGRAVLEFPQFKTRDEDVRTTMVMVRPEKGE